MSRPIQIREDDPRLKEAAEAIARSQASQPRSPGGPTPGYIHIPDAAPLVNSPEQPPQEETHHPLLYFIALLFLGSIFVPIAWGLISMLWKDATSE